MMFPESEALDKRFAAIEKDCESSVADVAQAVWCRLIIALQQFDYGALEGLYNKAIRLDPEMKTISDNFKSDVKRAKRIITTSKWRIIDGGKK